MAEYRVGYFVGSLSSKSINRLLAKALVRLAPAELEMIEIPIKDLPLYSQDYDADYPPVARALKQAIADVDAVLFVTPEFNRSIPGGLKNAIDWASRPFQENPFRGKPVLVIGASTGLFGAVWAQAEVRKVLSHIGAEVVDSELPVGHAHETVGESGLSEEGLSAELERQLARLVALARDPAAERDAAAPPVAA